MSEWLCLEEDLLSFRSGADDIVMPDDVRERGEAFVRGRIFDLVTKPKHDRINCDGKDWHTKRPRSTEPECGVRQWRQRDRYAVIDIAEMGDSHLGHAIRFAGTKEQHRSRLGALLAERARRGKTEE